MEETFIAAIEIKKVRHLENISIELSKTERKHLILTGKNGSGKTSVLKELKKNIEDFFRVPLSRNIINETSKVYNESITLQVYPSDLKIKYKFYQKTFQVVYFQAQRNFQPEVPKTNTLVDLSELPELDELLSNQLIKYLIQQEFKMLKAISKGQQEEATQIKDWFESFRKLLADIYEDESLELDSDIDNFNYLIKTKGREPFSFNQLSDGYASIIRIVTELLLRMEGKNGNAYDVEGIVMIDEIDAHLHASLQRRILPFLTTLFPKLQFIVTTHSPFILSSIDNAVIFDLETHKHVDDSLKGISYQAILESYFDVDGYDQKILRQFAAYEELLAQKPRNELQEEQLLNIRLDLKGLIDAPTLAPELKLKFNQLEKRRKQQYS